MNVRFSIIVPYLNSKNFLDKCLKSILNQTYKNYEIIVVDGGSNDGTVDYLKSYGNKIKWISEIDEGQADAINKGIKMSNGNWITWQNSDDYYSDDNALLMISDAIKSNPSKKLFVGNINLVDKSCRILRDVKYFKPSFYSLLYEGMTLTNQSSVWSSALNIELGMLKNLKINFDYEWYLRILKNYPDCGFHINHTIGCFRLHKLQKTQNQNLEDLTNLKKIKNQYGYKKNYFYLFKLYLLIRKFLCFLMQGNFHYLVRGIFKFFFGKKNEEYINS
jgi:glycosyltransferase involved in cell wall biosynthesis